MSAPLPEQRSLPMRRAIGHHHPHRRTRDSETRAVLRDPHALVVVDEAMGAHARQRPVALGLGQRLASK